MTRFKVVCDTGPLIALALLDLLERENPVFEFVTTQTVLSEWSSRDGNIPKALKVISDPRPDLLLSAQLDPGEASVIAAAVEHDIGNVLIDELRGRRVARRIYGLTVIGTARVLVEWRKYGWVDEIRPLLSQLQAEGYWISKAVVDWALDQTGELE